MLFPLLWIIVILKIKYVDYIVVCSLYLHLIFCIAYFNFFFTFLYLIYSLNVESNLERKINRLIQSIYPEKEWPDIYTISCPSTKAICSVRPTNRIVVNLPWFYGLHSSQHISRACYYRFFKLSILDLLRKKNEFFIRY